MIEVTRRYVFPAAHRLANPEFTPERNLEIFGKCANPNGHGHNYEVEVTVGGAVDEASGLVVDREMLDRSAEEAFLEPFGHRMLNELSAFEGLVPTAEVIADVIHDRLAPVVRERARAELVRVRVIETPNNIFEVGRPA